MAAQKSLKPKRSEMFKLYYVKPGYMKERLIEILQAGLSAGVKVKQLLLVMSQ